MSRIEELPIEQLVVRLTPFSAGRAYLSRPLQVTNTIPQTQNQQGCSKLVTIDVAPTISESIRRTHNGESISLLFGDWVQEVKSY